METQPERRPEIEHYDDGIVIRDVKFQTDFSFGGFTRYCGIVAKECSRYGPDVMARFEDSEFNCRDIMQLAVLLCDVVDSPNPCLDIYVKGRGEEAERVGLMLYSSLTSKEWEKAGVSRFPI